MIIGLLMGFQAPKTGATPQTTGFAAVPPASLAFQKVLNDERAVTETEATPDGDIEVSVDASADADGGEIEDDTKKTEELIEHEDELVSDQPAIEGPGPAAFLMSPAGLVSDADASAVGSFIERSTPASESTVSCPVGRPDLRPTGLSQQSSIQPGHAPEPGKHADSGEQADIRRVHESLTGKAVQRVPDQLESTSKETRLSPVATGREPKLHSETGHGGSAQAIPAPARIATLSARSVPDPVANFSAAPVGTVVSNAPGAEWTEAVLRPASASSRSMAADALAAPGELETELRVPMTGDRIATRTETRGPVSQILHSFSGNVPLVLSGVPEPALDQGPVTGLLDRSGRSFEAGRAMEGWSLSGSAPTAPGASSQAMASAVSGAPPTIRMVAEAVATAQRDRIEVSLSPEELGRVRILISQSEGGLHVTILSDRDETLSLLRRHATELSESFREIGLGSADIDFGEQDSGERHGERAEPAAGARGDVETGAGEILRDPIVDERLDIRL